MTKPTNEILTCRICFYIGSRRDFIAPCECKDHKKWVHRHCLDTYRAIKEDSAFSRCHMCRTPFKLECITEDTPTNRSARRLKLIWFVMRDYGFALILSQLVIAALGSLFRMLDNGRLVAELGMENHQLLLYYLVGLGLGFVFLGLMINAIGPLSDPDSNTLICCRGFEGCHGLFCYPQPSDGPRGPTAPDPNWNSGYAALVSAVTYALVFLCVAAFKTLQYIYFAVGHHYRVLVKLTLAQEYVAKSVFEETPTMSANDYNPPVDEENKGEDGDVESVIHMFDHSASGTGGDRLSEVSLHSPPSSFSWGRGTGSKAVQLPAYSPLGGAASGSSSPAGTPATPQYAQRQELLSKAQRLELVSYGLL